MKMLKKGLCLVLALVMLTMCACTGEEPVEPTDVTTTAPTEATTQTTVPTVPTEPEPQNINMITGLNDMGDTELTRPVGIMVANNDFIQDEQVGLASADMWVEIETEGGITRIMAVFANTERVPDAIGPVRSARSPFFHVVEALGLAYCHAGGSYTALGKIANSYIADLDVNSDDYSWRDSSYPHDYEYTLRTNADELTRYMNDRGYKTYAVNDFPWTFGEATGEAVSDVDVVMSGSQRIGFEWNEAEGVFYKTNGAGEYRHVDISGAPITAKNVLVLYSGQFWENDTTIDFYLSSGKGYLFSDGKMRRFDWSRDGNGFTMTEEDGSQLTLAPGKVYMCVASDYYESSLSY